MSPEILIIDDGPDGAFLRYQEEMLTRIGESLGIPHEMLVQDFYRIDIHPAPPDIATIKMVREYKPEPRPRRPRKAWQSTYPRGR